MLAMKFSGEVTLAPNEQQTTTMGHGGLQLILTGWAVGMSASLIVTRFLASLLFEVSPTSLPTFLSVSLLLATVALFACYIPARRATKVDPMEALRYE